MQAQDTPDLVDDEEGAGRLPFLTDGEIVQAVDVKVVTRKTKAPKPYTEDTLLGDMSNASKFITDDGLKKVMKEIGIGTPATTADTIEKLKATKMVLASGKTLRATDKAVAYIGWLKEFVPEIADVELTARWQQRLEEIAVRGGGADFERGIAQDVRDMVAKFRAAPPMAHVSTNSTDNSMSDTPRISPPTGPMLAFAQRLGAKLNIELPPEVVSTFDGCKAFLDLHKDAAMRPSEKAVAFAKRLAEEKGVELPAAALTDFRECSAFIDAHKSN